MSSELSFADQLRAEPLEFAKLLEALTPERIREKQNQVQGLLEAVLQNAAEMGEDIVDECETEKLVDACRRATLAHLNFAFEQTPDTVAEVLDAISDLSQYLELLSPLMSFRQEKEEKEMEEFLGKLGGMAEEMEYLVSDMSKREQESRKRQQEHEEKMEVLRAEREAREREYAARKAPIKAERAAKKAAAEAEKKSKDTTSELREESKDTTSELREESKDTTSELREKTQEYKAKSEALKAARESESRRAAPKFVVIDTDWETSVIENVFGPFQTEEQAEAAARNMLFGYQIAPVSNCSPAEWRASQNH